MGPNMGIEFLEINRLNESGETDRRIRCLVTRVSVFRSQAEVTLQQYIQAIEGKPTKDRFTLLIDGTSQFRPEEHNLIGFDEKFTADSQANTGQYLAGSGCPSEDIDATLLGCGLGGLITTPLSQLTVGQERTLRLLAATYQRDKILILNDPFQPIPDAWRERLAELLVRFAWQHKGVVIVVRLSYRPDCWIENEHITRIPLERPRQHTIGIGGGEFSSASVMTALREQLAAGKPGADTSPNSGAGLTTEPQPVSILSEAAKPPKKKQPLVWGSDPRQKQGENQLYKYAFVLLLSFTITGIALVAESSWKRNALRDPAISTPAVVPPPMLPIVATAPRLALDEYPGEIKETLALAFSNPDQLLRSRQTAAENTPTTNSALRISPQSIPEVPAETSNIQEYQEQQPEVQDEMTEEQIQARREEIRRKFLEAVQRQAEASG